MKSCLAPPFATAIVTDQIGSCIMPLTTLIISRRISKRVVKLLVLSLKLGKFCRKSERLENNKAQQTVMKT